MQPALRDILNGKRPKEPATLLAALVNAFPGDRDKQRAVFRAILIEDATLTRACIEYTFDDLISAPPK